MEIKYNINFLYLLKSLYKKKKISTYICKVQFTRYLKVSIIFFMLNIILIIFTLNPNKLHLNQVSQKLIFICEILLVFKFFFLVYTNIILYKSVEINLYKFLLIFFYQIY